tara:strand:- start:3382 stop:3591 length:210 start_codon:yes stop_codon:yes gene_type:complete
MRHIEVAPIIHYEVAQKYGIDELSVDENKINELAEKYKQIIDEQNEQAFINFVINSYGDFLSSNQSETE